MAISLPDLVAENGTYTTTGTKVNLAGTAVTGHRTFPAAVAASDIASGDGTYVLVKEDDTHMEVWYATFTDATPDTITQVTKLTSIGSLTNNASVEVYVGNPSILIELVYFSARGYIEGLELNYNAGTLKCLEGKAWVNGELLSVGSAGTTTISGDALSGTSIYYIYIYNNSGTVQMHREARASTADDPVWDTALDYAKHPVDGASKRCIGAVSVGAGSAGVLDEFTMRQKGRERRYYPYKYVARVVSAGSATTATSVDCQASVPAVSICREGGFKLHTKNASIGSTAVVYILWAQTANGATNFGGLQVSSQMDNASPAAALGPMIMPIDSTTFYYLVNNAGTQGFVDVISWGLYV